GLLAATLQHSTGLENELSLQQETASALWKRYEFIVNASKEWICVLNADLTFEAVNDAFCHACKKTKKRLVGHPASLVWSKPEELARVAAWVAACVQGQEIHAQIAFDMGGVAYSCVDVLGMSY